MRAFFRLCRAPLVATAFFACSGDKFAPLPLASAGAGGESAGSSGAAGSSSKGGANAGTSGTGGTGGGAGTGGSGGKGGEAGEGGAPGVAGAAGMSASGGATSGSAGAFPGGASGASGGGGSVFGGMGGTSSGAGGGAGSSSCVASSCPQPQSPCAQATCTGGGCATMPNPAGAVPPIKGNCRSELCLPSSEEPTLAINANDIPDALGACDIPSCRVGVPHHENDWLLCGTNTGCAAGTCKTSCSACVDGSTTVGVNAQTVCQLPPYGGGMNETLAFSVDNTIAGFGPENAADGNVLSFWNAGRTGSGPSEEPVRIGIGFGPRTMSFVYLSVNVTPDVAGVSSTIDYELEITTTLGKTKLIKARLVSGVATNAIVVFPLEQRVEVKYLKIAAKADHTWIAINEVYYRDCE